MTSLKNFKAALGLAALILLAASTSNATITLRSISGVSKADPVVAGNASIGIYGGLAGTGRCQTGPSTCDSCASVTTLNGLTCADGTSTTVCGPSATPAYYTLGCNNQMIGSDTIISITFTSTTTGNPVAWGGVSGTGSTGGAIALETTGSQNGTSYAAGSTINLSFTWANLCAVAGCSLDTSATGSLNTSTFTFGISTAANTAPTDPYSVTVTVIPSIQATYEIADERCSTAGAGVICTYTAYPGDSKVTITNPDVGETSFPTISGTQVAKAVRLYYEPTTQASVDSEAASGADFINITPSSGYAELPLDASGDIIGNARVSGLNNNTVYVFKLAHVDQAGNVGLFTASDTPTPTSDLTCATASVHDCHISQPGAVDGVLAKTLNCFVATASYGSAFAPKVQTFRDFRNRFLLHNKWGLKFVDFYYSGFGPKAAKVIARSETLRGMSRAFLFPIWCFATLSLDIGLTGALLVTFAFFALIALTVRACSQHLRMDV